MPLEGREERVEGSKDRELDTKMLASHLREMAFHSGSLISCPQQEWRRAPCITVVHVQGSASEKCLARGRFNEYLL